MEAFIVVLYTLVIVISLLLIALILVQQPKSSGFNMASLGESVFGAHAGGHMTKLTVIFTTIFFVLTLTLAIVVGHRPEKGSVATKTPVKTEAKQSADSLSFGEAKTEAEEKKETVSEDAAVQEVKKTEENTAVK